jgi:cobalt-zinc-cadmium efflux system membrane fusion protein
MIKAIISVTSVLILSACTGKNTVENAISTSENQVTLSSEQVKNAGIIVGPMEYRQISTIVKVNGKVDVPPQNMVSVSVPLGGYLRSTKLLPGMHVSKGEVIAIMEDQQYIQLQQDFLTAKAKISFLENEYRRQKELNQSQSSSDKSMQLAESEFRSQEILIRSLEEKLKLVGIYTAKLNETNISRSVNIYAPITGFVSRVNVNIGKYVSPTEVLFELINPDDIHLALKVFEKDLDKIYIGQTLLAYTNNHPEKKYACGILLIGQDLSIERNAEVHCHFKEYDKTLVPGTFMNAEIELKNSKAQVLPSDAVVRYEGKQYIYLVQGNNTFIMKEVEAGETENGYTEIRIPAAEVKSGPAYVTHGAYSLLMKLKNKAE